MWLWLNITKYPVVWILFFFFSPCSSIAQQFVRETLPINKPYDVAQEANWADIDQDGDWDLFLERPYWNHGSVFTLLNSFRSEFMYDWGDFNQDGQLDQLGAGHIEGGFSRQTGRIRNISPFNGCEFMELRSGDLTVLKGVFDPNSDYIVDYSPAGGVWGDHDQDGDEDIVFSSRDSSRYFHTRLFHWQQGRYQVIDTLPVQGAGKELFWQDMDRDGDLDLLMKGVKHSDTAQAYVLQNIQGIYQVLSLPAPYYQIVDHVRWGDLDNDGDLDLIQVGHNGRRQFSSGLEIALFENGQYQWMYRDAIEKLNDHGSDYDVLQGLSVEVGDVDNDGKLDVVVFPGFRLFRFPSPERSFLRLYHNKGNFIFQADADIEMDQFDSRSTYVLLDYDHDGDLDVNCGDQLWRNAVTRVNAKPSIPTGLTSLVTNRVAKVSWQPAVDDHTLTDGLTYNIHIFTDVGQKLYLNGLSNLSNGYRNVLKPGNAGALIQKMIQNLPDGKYYWTVQAIDQNYSASEYAPLQSFTVNSATGTTVSIQLTQPQLLNSCECGSVSLGVKPIGTFAADNRFVVQLSDSTGSFQQPTTLYNQLDDYRSDVPINQDGLWDNKAIASLSQTVQQGTRYRVRVMSTNPIAVSADNGYDIAIKKRPQLAEISLPHTDICYNPPNTVLRLSQLSQYANEYEWEIQPAQAGTFIRKDSVAEIDWENTFLGTALIWVRGYNGCGPGPRSAPVAITINPSPNDAGLIQDPSPICAGQQKVVFEIDTIPGAQSYQWKLPAGISIAMGTPATTNRILLDIGANFRQGTLEVAGLTVCGAGKPALLTLEASAKITALGEIAGEDTLCSGQASATFTVRPIPNATQYIWQIPPGFIPQGQQTTMTPTIDLYVTRNDFRDTLRVQGVNACFSGLPSSPFVVSVLSAPAQPAVVTGPDRVCRDQSVIEYHTTIVKGAVSYHWQLPQGVLIVEETGSTASIRVQVTESFVGGVIQVAASNQCGISTASLPFTVQPYERLTQPTITQSCNQLAIDPTHITKIQWYLDQIPLVGAIHSQLDITQPGEYTVWVQGVCDTLGATLKATPVLLNREDVPSVVTPNGDQWNQTFQLSKDVRISQLTVYNRWGKIVYQAEPYQNDWSGEELPTGMYYYLATVECLSKPIRGVVELLR